LLFFFFFTATATTHISPLSLHDALPISRHTCRLCREAAARAGATGTAGTEPLGADGSSPGHRGLRHAAPQRHGAVRGILAQRPRSEEHTSELQSRFDLVCRLLLEKKKKK